MFFETVRPFHFFSDSEKAFDCVWSFRQFAKNNLPYWDNVSYKWRIPKKKRSKVRWRKQILENDFTPKYM